MADVFLSYSNKDRAVATRVERALTAAGYDVFWDQETPTGKDWNSWIREKLGLAKVVVVLWSKASVSSNNVVHEATIALKGGKLIPALIEALDAEDFPMGMFTVQGANLRGYNGGDHPGMAKLLAAVEERVGKAAPDAIRSGDMARAEKAVLDRQQRRMKRAGRWLGIAALIVAALIGANSLYLYFRDRQEAEALAASVAQTAEDVNLAAALGGDWHWTGLACGEGPHIALEGDDLIVTMKGAPTFTHAITARPVNDGKVGTIVTDPVEARNEQYEFTRSGETLEVKNLANGQVDTWEKCP